jgi:hypothetical protein
MKSGRLDRSISGWILTPLEAPQGSYTALHWTATVKKELYRWLFRLVGSWRLGWAWSD